MSRKERPVSLTRYFMDAAEHFQELRAPDARGPSLARQALAGFLNGIGLCIFKTFSLPRAYATPWLANIRGARGRPRSRARPPPAFTAARPTARASSPAAP